MFAVFKNNQKNQPNNTPATMMTGVFIRVNRNNKNVAITMMYDR